MTIHCVWASKLLWSPSINRWYIIWFRRRRKKGLTSIEPWCFLLMESQISLIMSWTRNVSMIEIDQVIDRLKQEVHGLYIFEFTLTSKHTSIALIGGCIKANIDNNLSNNLILLIWTNSPLPQPIIIESIEFLNKRGTTVAITHGWRERMWFLNMEKTLIENRKMPLKFWRYISGLTSCAHTNSYSSHLNFMT